MSPSPAMMRCAASTIVCRPDEQNRLIVAPGTPTGHPARSAIWRAMFQPVAPSGSAQPIRTSSTSAGSSFARAIACATTWPPSVAPWVMLSAPRHDLASPVRAAETMTASRIERFSFGSEACEQRCRRPERRIGVGIGCDPLHAARDVVEAEHVGIEHGAAAMERKAVAREIDDVDVRCARRDALLQDARAFVHERQHAALDDLVVGELARRDADVLPMPRDQRIDGRIGQRIAPARLVAIPARPALLAEAALFAQAIGDARGPKVRLLLV